MASCEPTNQLKKKNVINIMEVFVSRWLPDLAENKQTEMKKGHTINFNFR